MQAWYDAEAGKLDPFVLILEGSLPNEKLSGDGYFAAMGDNPRHGPADHDDRVDRPARAEGGRGRRRRHLRHLRRHPGDEEQPDRRDGPVGPPRPQLEVQGRHPDRQHPGLPGPAGQHHRDADVPRASRSSAARRCPSSTTSGRPKWLFERTTHESCNRAAFYEEGDFAKEYGDHQCLVKLGCKGPVVKCNVPLRGWVNGIGGCPNVGGICMACTMPGFPDKYMPFMDPDPMGGISSTAARFTYGPILRWGRRPEHQAQVRQGAGVAPQPRRAHHRLREALVEGRRPWRPSRHPAPRPRPASARCRGTRSRGSSGSLGIHTEIDFDTQKVNKCYSTSMIFRGFDIFMKGIDPRDTHFLTSRICGICGDNHCTTSVLCQNMAYGIYPPKLGNCAYNLAELADYMFDHAIYNDCMCNVDFCEQMVKDTNPCAAREGREDAVAARRHPRLQDDRRHHAGAQPVHGRVLPRDPPGGALHARDVLPVRRPPHAPDDDHAGRRERGHHAPDVHGLLRAADALHGLRQAHRADARRHLRLLPAGAAGLRRRRAARGRTWSAGAPSTTPTCSATTTRT